MTYYKLVSKNHDEDGPPSVFVPVDDDLMTRTEWEATMIRLPKEGWPESAWAALLDRHFEDGFTTGEQWALHLVRVDDGVTEQEMVGAAVKEDKKPRHELGDDTLGAAWGGNL